MKNKNPEEKKYSIFHFEDEPGIAQKYQDAFQKAGFIYRHFNKTPDNIIEIIESAKPDLIIMDTTLPGMDGFATARKIRDNKSTSLIPILGLSDVAMEAGVLWAKNLLMDDYLMHQDFNPADVVKRVLSILEPTPFVLTGREKKIAEKNRQSFAQRHPQLSLILAILLIISTPVSLYLYFKVPDQRVDYASRPPLLTVKIKTVMYHWQFHGITYEIYKDLYQEIYDYYHSHPVKYYSEDTKLVDYYKRFYEHLSGDQDSTLSDLVEYFKSVGSKYQLTEDQLAESIISFVQIIPYDDEKKDLMLSQLDKEHKNESQAKAVTESALPRFPYETLFDQKGICTDKVLLAIGLIRQMGYGVALFDFDHHVAAGIQCPKEHSTLNSGYCIAEVTAPGFFIGEIPADVDLLGTAIAKSAERYSQELWGVQIDELEYDKVRIYKLSQGKEYKRITEKAPLLLELAKLEEDISNASSGLQQLSKEDAIYEQKLIEINRLINRYTEIVQRLR